MYIGKSEKKKILIYTYVKGQSSNSPYLYCSMLGRSSTSKYVGMGDFLNFKVSKPIKPLLSLLFNYFYLL